MRERKRVKTLRKSIYSLCLSIARIGQSDFPCRTWLQSLRNVWRMVFPGLTPHGWKRGTQVEDQGDMSRHSYVPINKVSKFQRPALEKEPCEKSDCKLVRFECARCLRSNPEIQVLIQNKKTQCDFKRKSSTVDSVHCFQVFLFRILLKLTWLIQELEAVVLHF